MQIRIHRFKVIYIHTIALNLSFKKKLLKKNCEKLNMFKVIFLSIVAFLLHQNLFFLQEITLFLPFYILTVLL